MTDIKGWAWSGVPGGVVPQVWNDIWPLLSPCVDLDGGRYDEDTLFEALRLGDMQLWVAGDGSYPPRLVVTTEIRVYPCQKWLNIKYVGGKGLPFAFDFLGTIEAWAREQGCCGCEGGGRPEWSRLLAKQGYRDRGLAYEKRFQ